MAMAFEETKPGKVKKVVLSLAVGGVVGFLSALGFMQLADSGLIGGLDTSREIAGLVGLLYVVTALFVAIGLANPKVGARFLNVEDADELDEQRKMLTWSVLGMLALGAALFVAALAAPAGPLIAEVAVGVVVLLVGLGWYATRRQREHTDELMLSVSRETTSTAFYLLFLFGGGWALIAHAGMIGAPQPIDWLTMFAGIMLVAAYWVCGKRGMLTPR